MLIVSHNLTSMNTQRQLGINTKNRAKATEKLSSGFDINRAADNAAGLAISEKMRRLIRGLEQGTRNAEDGISWTQIGDGALNEAHDILQRMNEISIQALNETNSESDRMALQQEFDNLQTELDRISETTKFNELNIFKEHEATYYQCLGDIKWEPEQIHVINEGNNDLVIKYRKDKDDAPKTMTITVPAGEYRTQELVDEIDSALEDAGGYHEGMLFEFNKEGYCNVNYEGGEVIDSVAGALSYLLYDMYEGGDYGALIGTTSFDGGWPLYIGPENNTLTFTIEDFDGNITEKTIVIEPAGDYYREDLIDYLNNKLTDTTVKATEYGSGIKLGSDEAIVTKFKGNMFKIDTGDKIYTSVFYDNVGYGKVTMESGYFQGGYVLTSNSKDLEHQKFVINDTNNVLRIKANGADDYTELVIDQPKEYTAAEMASKLNELFTAKGLELKATDKAATGPGSVPFYGIRIDSTVKGLDSKIELDTTSSAYETLFVKRVYNNYGAQADIKNEDKSDNEAYFKGTKDLEALKTTPLTVVQGQNDAFMLDIGDGSSYKITIPADEYNSISELVTAINGQLSGSNALSGYDGKVEAVADGNYLMIRGTSGSGVGDVLISAATNNTGFDSIFQGYDIDYVHQKASGTGSVTLNGTFDGKVEAGDNPLSITVGGEKYDVTLPTGDNVSQNDIITAIQTKIPGYTEIIPNDFSDVTAKGQTISYSYSPKTTTGRTAPPSWSGSAKGVTTYLQGTTTPDTNDPAKLTIDITPNVPITIDDSTDSISLTINGVTRVVEMAQKTYNSVSDIASELQSKINSAFGSDYGGATVSTSGGKLVLTARLGANDKGETTSISCGVNTSPFLKEMGTVRTPAEWTSNYALSSESIVIDDTTDEFVFSYKHNDGSTETITLELGHGTYNRNSLVNEINNQLKKQNKDVTASVNSTGKLALTSGEVGKDVAITYGTTTGGSSSNVIFGPMEEKTAANALVPLKTEEEIKIDNTNNQFTITVNGVDKTVTLTGGTYNRNSFVSMLNPLLKDIGVEAYVSDDKIGYKTLAEGKEQALKISYVNSEASMKAIYGVTEKVHPPVTASFTTDGKLKLETSSGTPISVSSASGGGGLQVAEEIITAIGIVPVPGYSSIIHGTIDGVNLPTDGTDTSGNPTITIDEWNDELKFTFIDNGTSTNKTAKLTQGTYTYDTLKTALQNQLDSTGTKLTVTVDAGGVKIETVGVGINNRLLSPSGDFYDKVMCGCAETSSTENVDNKFGTQNVTKAYTVGREDVATNGVTIREGISDELTIDFEHNGVIDTITMELTPGEYSGEGIKNEIQKKLNEQLVNLGFEPNLIEVGLGDIRTGVVGANDDKALNFRMSKTVKAPEEGRYVIDGVGGNAAFEVFYKTDGEMIPAYVRGSRDVTGGIMIKEGENELHFKVDDVEYDITLDPAYYGPDTLINEINKLLEDEGAPLVASLDEGRVKISHTKLGDHKIQEVSGSARDDVFFREQGEEKADRGVNIQLSSEREDHVEIPRTEVSTTLLGVNSICISKVKYATKAVDRLSEAISKVSEIRSILGSSQNKLEHAINNNENKAENTTAAESRIRDTDMAEMMMEQAKLNILQQAGEAMLSHANTANDGILALLG